MIVDSYPAGTPSWVDLAAADQDTAIAFYCDLFGWQAELSGEDMGNYAMCMKGDRSVAGIGPMPDGSPFPAAWTTYISVDDVDAVVAAATDAGGSVIAPAMTVAGEGPVLGRLAVLVDPAGAVFGLWEPHRHKGSGLANEPGAFTWNELLSRDPQASRDFLGALFGYEWEPMAGMESMDYYSAKVGDRGVAGVMKVPATVPADAPSYWLTYFGVDDTDDTVARAVASGGTVQVPAFDSPFGRMGVLSDPEGAVFAVVAIPAD